MNIRIIQTAFLFLFSFLSLTGTAQVQLINSGYVVSVSNAENCYPLIITDNRDVLEVLQSDIPIELGQHISFASVSNQSASPCVLGEQVNIYVTGLNSTGNSHQLCDYTECVLPGDTNKDGLVDMTDMVSIFLSQGLSGSFRPQASNDFNYQYSSDWGISNYYGNDFKHLDTDGNGIVLDEDIDVVYNNYDKELDAEELMFPSVGDIGVDIQFESQEISLSDFTDGEDLLLSATIDFTSLGVEFEEVSAISFSIDYPDFDFVMPQSVVFSKEEDSGFFDTNNIYPNRIFKKDDFENKRADFSIANLKPSGNSGIGRLGRVDFIIISDIIGGRSEPVIDIEITIDNIKVHNKDGSISIIESGNTQDELTVINDIATSQLNVEEQDLEIKLFPVPVMDELTISWSNNELSDLSFRMINAQGKVIQQQELDSSLKTLKIPTSSYAPGCYFVELVRQDGVYRKSFIKH